MANRVSKTKKTSLNYQLEITMPYYPEPPYFLMFAGFAIALAAGTAFAATLKLIVANWSSARAAATKAQLPTGQLIIPYLGINAGILVFLSAGLEIFGFPGWLATATAAPLTVLIGLLVWYQLGSMLSFVEKKGFESLDLDSWR